MYDHVLVGTDGSATATKAVEAAAQLAPVHRARLTIAHAFDPREPGPRDSRGLETEFPWLWSSGARAEALVNAAIDDAQAATSRAAASSTAPARGARAGWVRAGSPAGPVGERRLGLQLVDQGLHPLHHVGGVEDVAPGVARSSRRSPRPRSMASFIGTSGDGPRRLQ